MTGGIPRRRSAHRLVIGVAVVMASTVAAAGCSGHTDLSAPPVARRAPATTTTVPTTTTTTIATLVSADQVPVSTELLAVHGPTAVSAVANGPAVTFVAATIWGATTTLPVLATDGTWAQVMLPGPPNGATGWVPLTAGTVESDPWFLEVDMVTRQITAFRDGAQVATSPAAIGKPSTPTPVPPGNLSFLTGSLTTTGKYRVESPALRPLALQVTGQEAQVDDAAVGGSQVAIHGWEGAQTDPAIWGPTSGLAVSHACVRVPRDFALGPLTAAPNGTLVRFVTS
jgi:hypothetical protein